jgi:phage virion morphogenesis protein
MIAVKYTINDLEAKVALKDLSGRLSKPQKALKECGLVLLRSVAKTFKAGGRPVRWKASARAKAAGGKTLIDTARLMRSVTIAVSAKSVTVGTNAKYARIHQLGGRIKKNVTVKKHWRYMAKAFGKTIPARHVLVEQHRRNMDFKMPARPFLVIQAADRRIFTRIFGDYLTK